jgi:shikimate dehydrogenase
LNVTTTTVTATTPLHFAVIGDPVAHSKSPAIHTAAYRALGLPHTYEKLLTTNEALHERVDALRTGEFAGLNVTVPHKTSVLHLVDEIDISARTTGAANTLVRDPTTHNITAHNTDAPALAYELVRLAGHRGDVFAGRSALVIGNGGAARAAIFALGSLGVAHVVVRARRPKAEAELTSVLHAGNPNATMSFELLSNMAPRAERSDLIAIVQATTAGMEGAAAPGDAVALAVAWDSLPDDCVVIDVVYVPPHTPLLALARERGLANDGGVGMLARQGALAFELWLGVPPPFDVMLEALTRSLASR